MDTNHALPLLAHATKLLQRWWLEPDVEDILMQRPGEVWVQKGGVTTRHDIEIDNVEMQAIAILAASLKRQNVGSSFPLLSCDLPGGTRLQAVLPPCVRDGTVALAIRRPKTVAPTLDELSEGGIFDEVRERQQGLFPADKRLLMLYTQAKDAGSPEARQNAWLAFLKAAMRARKTCVMCGEVGSGKTHFSMGLANEIPLDDRLVTIQDADEWAALPHPNRVDLFYSKGDQGASRVTPNDLVEASLRLAMRWLLMQEIRGAEAYSFIRARRSGHPGLTTAHAKSPSELFPTLALMVKQHPASVGVHLDNIERTLRSLIDIVIHFHRPDGRFAISEIWFAAAEMEGVA